MSIADKLDLPPKPKEKLEFSGFASLKNKVAQATLTEMLIVSMIFLTGLGEFIGHSFSAKWYALLIFICLSEIAEYYANLFTKKKK